MLDDVGAYFTWHGVNDFVESRLGHAFCIIFSLEFLDYVSYLALPQHFPLLEQCKKLPFSDPRTFKFLSMGTFDSLFLEVVKVAWGASI